MTTYYVSAATGSDSDDGLSEANAFLTIQKAHDTADNGDIIYIKADGNYNEMVTLTDAGGASHGTTIQYIGYSTTTGDGGMATIDGQSTRTNCMDVNISVGYLVFANLRFTGATGAGVDWGTGLLAQYVNCKFDNNGGAGFVGQRNWKFTNCEFSNNGAAGVDVSRITWLLGCELYGNTGDAMNCDQTATVYLYKTLMYEQGANGFDVQVCEFVGNCTFDGENNASIDAVISRAIRHSTLINSIFYDLNRCFVYNNSTIFHSECVDQNNLYNSNNTADGHSHNDTALTHSMAQMNAVTSAPAFSNEASNDYQLGTSSPARDAGAVPGNY